MKNISLKLIFRSWRYNKAFTIISILSLAVGIACTNLLLTFVIHEYNLDPYNPNKSKIVLAQQTIITPGLFETGFRYVAGQPAGFTNLFIEKVPELELACVLDEQYNSTCKVGEYSYSDFKFFEADSNFVQLFPQHVLVGSIKEALNDPNKIVLTESFSNRLFGKKNPIGQIIQIQTLPLNDPEENLGIVSFTVSAIVKKNYQDALAFDALFFGKPASGTLFFLLKDNVTISELQIRTKDQLIYPDNRGRKSKYLFVDIQEIAFDKDIHMSPIRKPNTNLLFIALFSAILILAIACFNYVNLSFSRVFKQLYSIHVQKLMGAGSKQLGGQLFADTFLTVGLGFIIAQLIQYDLLLVLNSIISVRMPFSFLYSHQVLPVSLALILVLAFIPALYMSRRLPKMSISVYNDFYRGKTKQRIITSLVVLQFIISFVLMISAFSMRRQLSLIYQKTENYKNLYAFSANDNKTSMKSLKEHIANFPGVKAAALSNTTLYHSLGYAGQYVENGETKSRFIMLDFGDEGIMKTMGHKLIQGLTWEDAIEKYSTPVFLNRTYAQALFPEGNLPVGDMLNIHDEAQKNYPFGKYIIGGVVEDYFRGNLESAIDAGIIVYNTDRNIYLLVRIDPEQTAEVIKYIYKEGHKLYPEQNLEHKSMYTTVLRYNKKIIEMSKLLMMYSVISLMLTCFGLFGMTLYAIEQRTKEIGIRKVNGATVWQIMMMLNRRFLGWIGIAYVIAVPITCWIVYLWMQNFVHRAGFSIWIYILPLLVVVGITLLSVFWHSYKAASGNPIGALKDE